jgi:hypothetical protein
MEKTEVRGEDVALIETFLQIGFHGFWVYDVPVQHFIPSERLTKTYLWKYCVGLGQTMVRRKQFVLPTGPTLFGYPRWMIRQYVQTYTLSCLLSPVKNAAWCRNYLYAARLRGMMNELKSATSNGL